MKRDAIEMDGWLSGWDSSDKREKTRLADKMATEATG